MRSEAAATAERERQVRDQRMRQAGMSRQQRKRALNAPRPRTIRPNPLTRAIRWALIEKLAAS